jgi:hypothetical protein
MSKVTIASLAVIGVMAGVSFGVVLNEPWVDAGEPPDYTVPEEPSPPTGPQLPGEGEEVNECHVTREGMRPAEFEREFWQSFQCADGYEFTLVWGQSTIRNTFGNALREDTP